MSSDRREEILSAVVDDPWIKVAGIDVDGVLRGKDIAHSKFVKAVNDSTRGVSMCSVIFGWDITDELYHDAALPTTHGQQFGYPDMAAIVDLDSYRRIPWENNMPLFLVFFHDAKTLAPMTLCPRNVLASQLSAARSQCGVEPLAGIEYEFFHYKSKGMSSSELGSTASSTPASTLPHLSTGMFTYSLSRPAQNKAYYGAIKDATHKFNCPIDGLHTESGPVYEASLAYDTIDKIADRGVLFKHLIKCIAGEFEITPTFMAKPVSELPGNSGHVHISLVDSNDGQQKLFDRKDRDSLSTYPALEYVSDAGRAFLAGLLAGLPDILPMLCPTVNSYKRLAQRQFWTASSVSWGVDNRNASVRVIPGGAAGGTRFECRVPGADASAPYVLAALVGCGLRGMREKLSVEFPPLEGDDASMAQGFAPVAEEAQNSITGQRKLSRTLKEAVMDMSRKDSIAREIFGDEFVAQFAATRMQEVRMFEETVTDWETSRYLERV